MQRGFTWICLWTWTVCTGADEKLLDTYEHVVTPVALTYIVERMLSVAVLLPGTEVVLRSYSSAIAHSAHQDRLPAI